MDMGIYMYPRRQDSIAMVRLKASRASLCTVLQ